MKIAQRDQFLGHSIAQPQAPELALFLFLHPIPPCLINAPLRLLWTACKKMLGG